MAMSSLSAALVSMSAVADPALANSGDVAFSDEKVSGKTVEEKIREALGNTDNDENRIDAIKGETFDLDAIATILRTGNTIIYTDVDGLEQPVKIDSDGISFRADSAASILDSDTTGNEFKGKKDCLSANRTGSSTLTITIKGKVKLGGGKNDNFVTLKHTVDIDVHEANSYGLVAYKGGKLMTEDDLNNLAAYGDTIDFTLVQYTQETEGDFNPILKPVKANTGTAVAPGYVSKASLRTALTDELKKSSVANMILPKADPDDDDVTVLEKILADVRIDGDGAATQITPGTPTADTFSLGLKKTFPVTIGWTFNVNAWNSNAIKKAWTQEDWNTAAAADAENQKLTTSPATKPTSKLR